MFYRGAPLINFDISGTATIRISSLPKSISTSWKYAAEPYSWENAIRGAEAGRAMECTTGPALQVNSYARESHEETSLNISRVSRPHP